MIIIVNYGMGNLNSVKRKLSKLGVNSIISEKPSDILNADKLILPGVGHFGKAVENLKQLHLWESLNEAVLVKTRPILGICLGMQLMAQNSEEGNANGFGWINGSVVKFKVNDFLKHKIPHTGWNQIKIIKDSIIMNNIPDMSEFYFVHSYHFMCNETEDILNETEYEYNFTSAVEKGNIFGAQYHPEKSHEKGDQLFRNFISV